MVVQRKYVKKQKQTVKNEKSFSFYGRPLLHEITPKIASTGLHKKDITKINLKVEKTVFFFPFF